MSYTHFTLEERKYLQQLLSEGLSFRIIAAILERSPSTISREVKRNRSKHPQYRKRFGIPAISRDGEIAEHADLLRRAAQAVATWHE